MSVGQPQESTFLEHVQELRNRLMISVLLILAGSIFGYTLFERMVVLLSHPLDQSLYYSAPTGELSFVIKVCVIFGLTIASPFVFYQIIKYIQPLFDAHRQRKMVLFLFSSMILAICGVLFAYYFSLPMTIKFLLGVQDNNQTAAIIKPLISADEYFNFVLTYIAGFAILFQIPLIVLIIDKITPLKPRSLLGSFRYVVLFSFIASAIITPTPDPLNQSIMAMPMIVLYMISATMLVVIHAMKRTKKSSKSSAGPGSTSHYNQLSMITDNIFEDIIRSDEKHLLPNDKNIIRHDKNVTVPKSYVVHNVKTDKPKNYRYYSIDGISRPTQRLPKKVYSNEPIKSVKSNPRLVLNF